MGHYGNGDGLIQIAYLSREMVMYTADIGNHRIQTVLAKVWPTWIR